MYRIIYEYTRVVFIWCQVNSPEYKVHIKFKQMLWTVFLLYIVIGRAIELNHVWTVQHFKELPRENLLWFPVGPFNRTMLKPSNSSTNYRTKFVCSSKSINSTKTFGNVFKSKTCHHFITEYVRSIYLLWFIST